MTAKVQTMLTVLVVLLGLGLMIGGIVTHKYGGVDTELFARISEKNHAHSTLNPLAAYTKRMTLEEIMGDHGYAKVTFVRAGQVLQVVLQRPFRAD